MAFFGNPGAFPSIKEEQHFQKYIQWSDEMNSEVRNYLRESTSGQDYIAIHARIGIDMKNACASHFRSREQSKIIPQHYMGSQQCTGYGKFESFGKVFTKEVCNPSADVIARDLQEILTNTRIKHVFVATDKKPDQLISQIRGKVQSNVKFHYLSKAKRDSMLDLAIMVHSDVFIGTCPSTFSAFVSRYRQFNAIGVFKEKRTKNPNYYFGTNNDIVNHDEL